MDFFVSTLLLMVTVRSCVPATVSTTSSTEIDLSFFDKTDPTPTLNAFTARKTKPARFEVDPAMESYFRKLDMASDIIRKAHRPPSGYATPSKQGSAYPTSASVNLSSQSFSLPNYQSASNTLSASPDIQPFPFPSSLSQNSLAQLADTPSQLSPFTVGGQQQAPSIAHPSASHFQLPQPKQDSAYSTSASANLPSQSFSLPNYQSASNTLSASPDIQPFPFPSSLSQNSLAQLADTPSQLSPFTVGGQQQAPSIAHPSASHFQLPQPKQDSAYSTSASANLPSQSFSLPNYQSASNTLSASPDIQPFPFPSFLSQNSQAQLANSPNQLSPFTHPLDVGGQQQVPSNGHHSASHFQLPPPQQSAAALPLQPNNYPSSIVSSYIVPQGTPNPYPFLSAPHTVSSAPIVATFFRSYIPQNQLLPFPFLTSINDAQSGPSTGYLTNNFVSPAYNTASSAANVYDLRSPLGSNIPSIPNTHLTEPIEHGQYIRPFFSSEAQSYPSTLSQSPVYSSVLRNQHSNNPGSLYTNIWPYNLQA